VLTGICTLVYGRHFLIGSSLGGNVACEIAIIPDCDHFYVGVEERVSKTVTGWLEHTLG
jgi:hypothetical protein